MLLSSMRGHRRPSQLCDGGGTIMLTSLTLFLLLASSTVVSSYDSLPLMGRLLKAPLIYSEVNNNPTTCICKIRCAQEADCTSFSHVLYADGTIGCFYSNKTETMGWDDTDENRAAITFFMPGTTVAALTEDQKAEVFSAVLGVAEVPNTTLSTVTQATDTTTTQTSSASITAEVTTGTTTAAIATTNAATTTTTGTTTAATTTTTEPSSTTSTSTTTVATTTTAAGCDSPFFELDSVGCLAIFTETKNWDDATNHCANNSAHLYVAASEAEFQVVREEMISTTPAHDIWVGAKSETWNDGRQVSNGEWGYGSPNGPTSGCVWMLNHHGYNYKLGDKECSRTYAFLCEKD